MAGWVTTPLQLYSLNSTPTTGSLFAGLPSSYGYDSAGTGITAWGSNNVVFVPNSSGNTILWYYCGPTNAAGIAQVLVGDQLAGQVLPASTAQTIAVSSSGWLGPFSPATYNIQNVGLVPASVAGSPAGNMPAAAQGCFAVAFTTTTQLLVRAYSFANVQP